MRRFDTSLKPTIIRGLYQTGRRNVATKLVIGNWKMNGSLALNRALLEAISGEICCSGVVVCPPAPYLLQVMQLLWVRMYWSAHRMFVVIRMVPTRARMSATMLSDLGCQYKRLGT